uniref:Uncharacterized protein n=1 Tax=Calidris pygmaea TaxID=425635 RepID=A0A8C3J0K0_9CHAR
LQRANCKITLLRPRLYHAELLNCMQPSFLYCSTFEQSEILMSTGTVDHLMQRQFTFSKTYQLGHCATLTKPALEEVYSYVTETGPSLSYDTDPGLRGSATPTQLPERSYKATAHLQSHWDVSLPRLSISSCVHAT